MFILLRETKKGTPNDWRSGSQIFGGIHMWRSFSDVCNLPQIAAIAKTGKDSHCPKRRNFLQTPVALFELYEYQRHLLIPAKSP
jgi:hypothetical protein